MDRVNLAEPTRQQRVPTKEAIRSAAVEVFYERGYGAATVREIAARAGMKAGSIYNHYVSKQEILSDIMTTTTVRLLSGLEHALQRTTQDSAARLRRAIEHHVIFHGENRREAFLADRELRSLEPEFYGLVVQGRKAYEGSLEKIITEGQASRTFRHVDSKITTFAVISMCSGVATWYQPDGQVSLYDIAKGYADLVLAGLSI